MGSRHASQNDPNVLNRPRLARMTRKHRASGMRYQNSLLHLVAQARRGHQMLCFGVAPHVWGPLSEPLSCGFRLWRPAATKAGHMTSLRRSSLPTGGESVDSGLRRLAGHTGLPERLGARNLGIPVREHPCWVVVPDPGMVDIETHRRDEDVHLRAEDAWRLGDSRRV